MILRGGRGPLAVFAIATLTGFLPLFGAPGYEQSLLAGLWVPTFVAVAEARRGGRWTVARLTETLLRGLLYALAPLVASLVHVARGEGCGVSGGLVYYAWTAAPGILLGGLVGGVSAGLFQGRRRLAVAVAAALPFASALVSAGRFFTSPMIFAYDPFVGFFSGTLYDTVITPDGIATYRLGSALTVAALAAFTARREARGPQRRLATVALVVAAVGSVAITASGPALGHWHTRATIEAALGGVSQGGRCRVVYPLGTPRADVDLLVADCEAELRAAEAWFELPPGGPITAFFFKDAAQKRALMGAEHTYIAKPWREEVYLQLGGFPHPVLGHEIAHVVAGRVARGPFRVAGAVGGLWPNPGLIEGVASAASPDDDELTDLQWARALLDEDKLPRMGDIFSFRFFAASSAKSYTVAGAFVGWIRDRYGAAVIRDWYRGAPLEALVGRPFAALDEDFRAAVRAHPYPPAARAYAKGKFERPGLFGRRCPHAVDALRTEGDRLRGAGDDRAALCAYDAALALDREDPATRLGRAIATAARYPTEADALAPLEALAAPSTPAPLRDRAEDALAEAYWFANQPERAAPHWEALAGRSLDEDAGRTFEVKALAARDEDLRAAVGALLFGSERYRGQDLLLAGVRLGAVPPRRAGIAAYLIGKNLMNTKSYQAARPVLLDPSTGRGTAADGLSPRLGRELLRQRGILACALHDGPLRAAVLADVDAPDSPFAGSAGGRADALRRLLRRCAPGP